MIRPIIMGIYSTIIEPLINIIFPPICLFCDHQLDTGERAICTDCINNLSKAAPSTVQNLFDEINLKGVDKIYMGYEYSDKIKKMIHLFKYERFIYFSSIFATAIANSIENPEKIDLIVPVPLHRKKEYERGYNQSEEIVKQLSKLTLIEYSTKIIQRKKYTISQTTLNKNERMLNVSNAFICSDNIRDKRVLIVDDVITTGSTLKACAQCLLKKGAKSICFAAVTTPPFAS